MGDKWKNVTNFKYQNQSKMTETGGYQESAAYSEFICNIH